MIFPTVILLLLVSLVVDALSLQPCAFSAYRSRLSSYCNTSYCNRKDLLSVSFSETVLAETIPADASNKVEEEFVTRPESLQDEISIDDGNTEQRFWRWRNHEIFTEVSTPAFMSSNSKPKIILLHGFGASTRYWRETMTTLKNEGFEVHALDLLGQGRSSMPYAHGVDKKRAKFPYKLYPKQPVATTREVETCPMSMGKNTNTKVYYSINLWANMIDDYARHCNMDEVILMGNSLGSLVALSAATGDFIENDIDRENMFAYLAGNNLGERSRVKGVCLFNCAVGLNSMNILKNTNLSVVQRSVFEWIFGVLNNLIFNNEMLLKFALNNIVTKDLLRDALKSLYTYNPERVDDELVDSFYYPAKFGGDGAINAIRQIYCNDPGLSPMELHAKYPEILDIIPLHLIWGDSDVVTPIEGDVGKFYCDRVANNRGGKGMTTIDVVNAGHLLFDDNPSDTNNALLRWLNKKVL